ncbi:AHH domain-containing protein [Clostridium septicum]|uniref:AHH domain-containing protein n=1 Tax=Clostridium septicum TaxID=1504 RepID=UPI003D1BC384
MLERYGVDINSASNGVFLPDAPNYPHAGSAAVHRGSHTEAYYKYVRDELVNANVQSVDDVVDVLDNIRMNLLNGSITPNM